MALGVESQPTTSNCVPSNLTSIPETIPPICSALGQSYSSVPELSFPNSPHPLSDSGISTTSLSPESNDTCRFQQSLVQNNMGQMPYFANPHANPNCAQFYPQNTSFLPYDPNLVNYSAVLQNEVMAQRPRSPPKQKRKSTRSLVEIAAKRKIANQREKERNRKMHEAINMLHKRIHLKQWEKPTVQNILRAACMYIGFLRGKKEQKDYMISEAQVNEKLREDFNEWRLQREGEDLPKPN